MNNETAAFLKIEGLTKWYVRRGPHKGLFGKAQKQVVRAVDGVTLKLAKGEVLGVIGESGCGKSTLGRLLVELEEPTSGEILLEGESTRAMLRADPLHFRRTAQIVFQNPFDTFAPGEKVERILSRALQLHGIGASREERRALCLQALEKADLLPAADFLGRYPYELSGGQLQRISIVRSMLLSPRFLVADEPVSMLDVSVRAGIINLLLELNRAYQTTVLFISHDIATTRYISGRIAVMYLGRVVEWGEADEVLGNPLHPYTRALISNCASADPAERREPIALPGEVSARTDTAAGCAFAPRCFMAGPECLQDDPALEEIVPGHCAACLRCRAHQHAPISMGVDFITI